VKKFQATKTVSTVVKGKQVRVNVGEVVTETTLKKFSKGLQSTFLPVKGTAKKAETQVPVTDLTRVFLTAFDEGEVLEGGFREVFEQATAFLGVQAEWCHFRASHVGAAGRAFEEVTGVCFTEVCPNLPAHTDTWVSAL
jgi:hypothetical protein